MSHKEIFLQAINEKKIVKVKFDTNEKGCIERNCIPYDFGPSRRNLKIKTDMYHLFDLDSSDGSHNISILPDKIKSIELTNIVFDPSDYITWKPNWFIKRNWGIYS